MIQAWAVVRLTGPGTDPVEGLRGARHAGHVRPLARPDTRGPLRFAPPRSGEWPRGWARASCRGGRSGDGDGAEDAQPATPGFFAVVRRMARAAMPGSSSSRVRRQPLTRSGIRPRGDGHDRLDESLAHDVAVVTGIVRWSWGRSRWWRPCPACSFAPGHKTLLLYPLYVLAARLTRSRWGGTVVGSVMGVIGFSQGNGRFGVPGSGSGMSRLRVRDRPAHAVITRRPQAAVVYLRALAFSPPSAAPPPSSRSWRCSGRGPRSTCSRPGVSSPT